MIYVSKSVTGDLGADLDAILAVSVTRNSEVRVTGMLWSDGANFAQVIEGGHDEVGITMDRIRADSRHTDVEVVFDSEVTARKFGGWAMRRADAEMGSTTSTAFLIGLAITERTAAAKRLYEIIIATER